MSDAGRVIAAERLRRRTIAEDRPVFGAWVSAPSPRIIETLSATALDYLGIDCQHGLASELEVARMVGAAAPGGVGRIVRVSANRTELIATVLDGGADGVIVPTVNSVAEAEQAVRAARFPPAGIRSYGPTAAFLPRDPIELADRALMLMMIETRGGVEAAERIAAVPGVDGLYVGPADLGLSLGTSHRQFPAVPELEHTLERIAAAASAAGKITGIHAGNERFVARYIELGFRLLTLGNEASLLAGGVERALGGLPDASAGDRGDGSPY